MTTRQSALAQTVSTVAGLALAGFCAWQLHRVAGMPHSRIHDYIVGGVGLGCFLAFPGTVLSGLRALNLPFLKSDASKP